MISLNIDNITAKELSNALYHEICRYSSCTDPDATKYCFMLKDIINQIKNQIGE